MTTSSQASGLNGIWAHSFEEDAGDFQVYRLRDKFPFPPSRRGRETLDFQQPGQVVSGTPGPDDRQMQSSGVLTTIGMNRFRIGGARVLEVVESAPDVLKVRIV